MCSLSRVLLLHTLLLFLVAQRPAGAVGRGATESGTDSRAVGSDTEQPSLIGDDTERSRSRPPDRSDSLAPMDTSWSSGPTTETATEEVTRGSVERLWRSAAIVRDISSTAGDEGRTVGPNGPQATEQQRGEQKPAPSLLHRSARAGSLHTDHGTGISAVSSPSSSGGTPLGPERVQTELTKTRARSAAAVGAETSRAASAETGRVASAETGRAVGSAAARAAGGSSRAKGDSVTRAKGDLSSGEEMSSRMERDAEKDDGHGHEQSMSSDRPWEVFIGGFILANGFGVYLVLLIKGLVFRARYRRQRKQGRGRRHHHRRAPDGSRSHSGSGGSRSGSRSGSQSSGGRSGSARGSQNKDSLVVSIKNAIIGPPGKSAGKSASTSGKGGAKAKK